MINRSFKDAHEFSSLIYLGEVSRENEEASEDDGLLVGDIELLGDGGCGESGTEDDRASFGDEARRGDRLDDFLSPFSGRSGLCSHGTPGNIQNARWPWFRMQRWYAASHLWMRGSAVTTVGRARAAVGI